MIGVPEQLSPWAPQLERLPGELALGLYPLIARISSALEPLSSVGSGELGEPEGYAGLTRRGPYHRLLPSDWLLAFELPDEFLRRAASAEHAFFELATRETSGARRALVLFDAGPAQLGATRLVHLAALIAFARRAHAASAELCWGVLQAPEAGLVTGVSRAGIEKLLRARSAEVPTEEHARLWRARVGDLAQQDDAWLVGGTELKALADLAAWPRVLLEESLDPARRVVQAELEHAHRPRRRLVLDLPVQSDCVQLLRDPYRRAQPAPQRNRHALDVSRPLWFAGDGRRVFAWLKDGGVVSFPVPNSPRAQPGKARVFRGSNGETLLACGSLGRRLLALTYAESGLYLYGVPGAGEMPGGRRLIRLEPRDDGGVPNMDPGLWAPGVMFEVSGRIYARGAHGESLVSSDDGRLLRSNGRVLASAPLPGGGVLHARLRWGLGELNSELHVCLEVDGKELKRRWIPLERAPSGQIVPALCCTYIGYLSANNRCVLVRTGATRLLVFTAPLASVQHELHLPSGSELYGVIALRAVPCLLVLERDRRTLALLGRSTSHSFARASSEVEQVCASMASPHVAYLTSNGELVVHSTSHDAPLLRILPGGLA